VASGTSKKTELKLTNVAKASLEELRLDYEDYLRQRGLRLWEPDDPRRKALVARRCGNADAVAAWVVEVAKHGRDGLNGLNGQDGQDGPMGLEQPSTPSTKSIKSIKSILFPEISANAALVLIGVASVLLDRQVSAQAAAFEREGGFTERLYRTRKAKRMQE
jgi:four helix bundle suffix protein